MEKPQVVYKCCVEEVDGDELQVETISVDGKVVFRFEETDFLEVDDFLGVLETLSAMGAVEFRKES